jgi:glutathione S-transferase
MVQDKLWELGLSFVTHSVPKNKPDRKRVIEISGQELVPVLVDPNTNTVLDDEEKALKYLEENFGGSGSSEEVQGCPIE